MAGCRGTADGSPAAEPAVRGLQASPGIDAVAGEKLNRKQNPRELANAGDHAAPFALCDSMRHDRWWLKTIEALFSRSNGMLQRATVAAIRLLRVSESVARTCTTMLLPVAGTPGVRRWQRYQTDVGCNKRRRKKGIPNATHAS